jgi:hypothetical protein
MAATVRTTTFFPTGTLTSGVNKDFSVVRAAGDGLVIGVFYKGQFGDPSGIASVTWDAAGDNQAMTLVQVQRSMGANRYIAVYALAAPTTAKTGVIQVAFTSTANVDGIGAAVRHVIGHDTSSMIRSSAKFQQNFDSATPASNAFASAVGDTVLDFFFYRNEAAYLHAASGQAEYIGALDATSTTIGSSTKAGAASVTMGWTATDVQSYDSAHIGMSIQAAAVVTTVPDAPTIGAATVTGATTASINGTAPTNNGGAAIDNYRATLSPSGLTFTSATLPVPATGLATGTAQTARLEAHNSVGWSSMSAASNSFTPSAANQAPAFGGSIANISGTSGTAITPVNVASNFTDTDTLTYSASAGGTAWPSWAGINASTGAITGTPTGGALTTTGCKVRASDGTLTTDSNAFNFVIAAAATTKTYTSTKAMKRVGGAVAGGVSLTAIINTPSGVYVGTKTGVLTHATTGIPAPITDSFGSAGTPVRITWIEEAAPTNPAPTENVTPT